jgi:selenocysteine lyase/cysteine desulfurase
MTLEPKFLKKVREEFPTVEADPTGRRRSFLDNGAGTLVNVRSLDREVLARIDWSANVGNDFTESKGAEQTIHEGRQAVADLLNAGKPETIVSGESATSLLFSLSYAIGKELTGKENVVTTGYEHYTNVSPWVELGSNGLIEELRFAEFDRETGELDIEDLAGRIDEDTAVVTVTAASNLLGSKTDLKRVAKLAKEVGAYFIVDAVHHVAHGPIDVKAIGCDALVFSGYKLFARHGSYMYMRPDLVEDLCPYKVYASPAHGPEKWEWGTRDQAMFAAIEGAIDYLAWLWNPSAKTYPKAWEQRAKRSGRDSGRRRVRAGDLQADARGQGEGFWPQRHPWTDGLRLEGPGTHGHARPDVLFQAQGIRRPGPGEAPVGQVRDSYRRRGLLLEGSRALRREDHGARHVRPLQHARGGACSPQGSERGRGEEETVRGRKPTLSGHAMEWFRLPIRCYIAVAPAR